MDQIFSPQDTNYTPAQFFEHIQPTWARVYLEVFDQLKDELGPEELIWRDQRVCGAITRLIGFDPMQYSHRELQAQLEYIQLSREACKALYLADEVAKLDGLPALDYAQGWMAAYWWLRQEMVLCPTMNMRCAGANCPSEDIMVAAAHRHASMQRPQHVEAFLDGFRTYVSRHTGQQNARCQLSSECKAGKAA